MIKYTTLFVSLLFSLQICFAQDADKMLKERGEVYFSFDIGLDGIDKLESIGKFISIDNIADNKVFAYANAKGFKKFRETGYHYSVLTPPSMLLSREELDGGGSRANWDFYPTYDEYIDIMHQFATDYPSLCEVVKIGQSVQGRDLLFIHINDSLGVDQPEPEFMYTSTMHGDETTGYVLMLHLIEHLLENYGTDNKITSIVNSVDIWINPLANPDGTYASGNNSVYGATRFNANGVDLNRNYPDPEDGQHPDGNAYQVETVAFMDFADEHHFAISTNLHTGAEVANYPWDTWSKLAADNNWWVHVCSQYANTAHAYSPDGYLTFLNDGITNGYAWYSISGGRQDYMNYEQNCREFTLELSDIKLPPPDTLPAYWEYNYRSFISYLEQSLYGLRGIITDAHTGDPILAKVYVDGYDKDNSHVYSSASMGDYHRYLSTGVYSITYSAGGYQPVVVNNVVVSNDSTTYINVQLDSLVGIDEERLQNLVQVYPNPVKNVIHIILPQEAREISVINLIGETMHSEVSDGEHIQFELGHFPKGMYLLKIRFKQGTVCKKVIVY